MRNEQKILNSRRFSEIFKEDRNVMLTLMHCERLRLDYRCSFDEGLVMLAKLHRKYADELEVALAVVSVFGDDEEEDDANKRTGTKTGIQ